MLTTGNRALLQRSISRYLEEPSDLFTRWRLLRVHSMSTAAYAIQKIGSHFIRQKHTILTCACSNPSELFSFNRKTRHTEFTTVTPQGEIDTRPTAHSQVASVLRFQCKVFAPTANALRPILPILPLTKQHNLHSARI